MLTKLIKNSLYSFIFIFLLFFGFNKVKAYGYFQTSSSSFSSNGTINSHSDYNELFTNVAYGGSSFQYGCENSTPYWEQLVVNNNVYYANAQSWKYQCFYVLQNKNNSNSYAWGANKLDNSGSEDGRKPTSMFMYHVFPDNNSYNFVIIQSYAGSQNNTSNYMIYYDDTPPLLTYDSSSTYRLTATSKTYILHYRQGFNYDTNMGYNWSNYPWIYYLDLELDTGEYFQTSHSSMRAPLKDLYDYGFNGVNNNFNYYATEPIAWNTSDNSQEDFPFVSSDNGLDYEDLNSSGSVEEVEFTHNNITFSHLLKIKISDLYRSANSGYYKPYFLTYMSSISTGVESNFYITYDKTTSGKPNFPLSILFKENLGAIEKIANGSEEDPFSFEYYGNRLPECSIESTIPLSHTTYNDSPNFYNYLLLYPTWYCGYYGDTWEPTIWGNDYIYIYYNARLYNDLDTLEEDFENNPSNFEETNFFNYMVRSLDHFIGRIPSIFRLITIFFNSLPYEIRLMFIAVFTLIITLLIYKVIG